VKKGDGQVHLRNNDINIAMNRKKQLEITVMKGSEISVYYEIVEIKVVPDLWRQM
jgi:hypothetical protein